MIPERAEIKIEDVKTTIKELDKIRKEGKINNLNQIKEKLISNELFEEIETFWEEEIEQRKEIDYETDWEFLAYKKIYELLSTYTTNTTLSTLSTLSTLTTTGYFNLLKDVVEPVGLDLYEPEEFKKKKRAMSITIGKYLSRETRIKKRRVLAAKD